ncbi:MAG: mechanosensitive ion channel [Candidatus Aenigmarchaeota archaeon]|nr:mechanosensitive ion channel [Candidatus Aenigmarchaeota archaeon]
MLTKGLLYLSFLVTILVVLNLWLASQINWLNEFLKSTSILALSFVAGLFTSSILGNVLAYQIIIKRRDVKEGDRVKINEIYGDVVSIDFFYTHIRNLDNEILSIPNLILLTKGIKNFSKMDNVVIHCPLTLTHGTDFQKAKKVILKAVEKTEGVDSSKSKEPHLWIKEFTAWTINCEVRAHTKNVKEKDQIKYQMTENILTALNKEGITTGRD